MCDFLSVQMQLSKETIEKFKEIYERKEGIKLSDKEAFELASNFILMFDAVYQPIPLDNTKKSVRLKSANKNYGHTNDSN